MADLRDLIKTAVENKPVQFIDMVTEQLNKRAAKVIDKYKKTVLLKEDHCATDDEQATGGKTVTFPTERDEIVQYLKDKVNTSSIRKMSSEFGTSSLNGIARAIAGKTAKFDAYMTFQGLED